MADDGDSTPIPPRWDPVTKKYVTVYTLEEARILDNLNIQIEDHKREESEFIEHIIAHYSAENDVNRSDFLKLWNPYKNTYIEVKSKEEELQLIELNKQIEHYLDDTNEFHKHLDNLLKQYDLDNIKNLIEKPSKAN